MAGMAHPYRTPPRKDPPARRPESHLGVATLVFGCVCVLSAEALSGADRGRCALAGIALGTILLMAPSSGMRSRR